MTPINEMMKSALTILFISVVFFSCATGEDDLTTLIITPIRAIDGKKTPYAKVIFYNTKDSLINYARTDISDTAIYLNHRRYAEADSLGVVRLVDVNGNFLPNRVHYYYVQFTRLGIVYDNFSNELLPLSDSFNFSTISPVSSNTIANIYPYVYIRE